MITTYQYDIDLEGIPNVVISRTPKCSIDPDILRERRRPETLITPISNKFKTIYQLNYKSFDYLSTLQRVQNEVQSIAAMDAKYKIPQLFPPYIGLIERIILGELSIQDFMSLLKQNNRQSLVRKIDIDRIFLAYKVKAVSTINTIVYVISKQKYLFEVDLVNSKIKQIEDRKRATRDVQYFSKDIKRISLQEANDYLAD